ncbi:MAG: hypothetical protein PHN37_02295 [Candidatus Pacebacteria bacterium]|nr:hypothetical protein [Mesotoga sp.]MDD5606669.1 hypothetical protein [Candidatus Paceibacterota bacterium]
MNQKIKLLLKALFHPSYIIIYLWRKIPIGSFELKSELDAVERPNYAYCLLQAAKQAKNLGIQRISAIEFGVAGGRGLIELEKIADEVFNCTDVNIDVYGFDLEVGLPAPADYRDLVYVWRKGFYKMEKEKLLRRIKKTTKLVLGDVKETVPTFLRKNIAPIGFIAFDLDFYSSTISALKIFDAEDQKILPRVLCYFDDIIGPDEELHNNYTGELLAIQEFNQKHNNINGLIHKRIIKAGWCDAIYVLHAFDHPLYNTYIFQERDRQLSV